MNKRTTKKIQADLARIKQYARYVISFTPHGIEVQENEQAELMVIAVVGPCVYQNETLAEVVLLEIGISRKAPYNPRSRRHRADCLCGCFSIPRRYRRFQMNEEQYLKVAPKLFELMESYAREKVLLRKHDWFNPSFFYEQFEVYSKRKKTNVKVYNKVELMPHIKFNIARIDQMLMSDILWMDLTGSDERERKSNNTLSVIWNLLSTANLRWKDMMKYRRFASGIRILKSLPYYKQVFIWQQFFQNHQFKYEVLERIGYQNEEVPELILMNQSLPNLDERSGRVVVRITRFKKNYLVIEHFPDAPELIFEDDDEVFNWQEQEIIPDIKPVVTF